MTLYLFTYLLLIEISQSGYSGMIWTGIGKIKSPSSTHKYHKAKRHGDVLEEAGLFLHMCAKSNGYKTPNVWFSLLFHPDFICFLHFFAQESHMVMLRWDACIWFTNSFSDFWLLRIIIRLRQEKDLNSKDLKSGSEFKRRFYYMNHQGHTTPKSFGKRQLLHRLQK